MTHALRTNLPDTDSVRTRCHGGLVLDSWLQQTDDVDATNRVYDKARTGINNAAGSDFYKFTLHRWQRFASSLPSARLYKCAYLSRAIIGFGDKNVLETGITLHHSYGVPYLPGTALKGLCAHYAHQVWGTERGADEWRVGGGSHNTLFGSSDEGGLITFLDGWMAATANPIHDEILTPHNMEYYSGRRESPSPFEDPVPVRWLSVAAPFHICIAKRDTRLPDDWMDAAEELLRDSLQDWGIGAKTSSGYGRLELKVAEATKETPGPATAGKPAQENVTPSGELKANEVLNVVCVKKAGNDWRLTVKNRQLSGMPQQLKLSDITKQNPPKWLKKKLKVGFEFRIKVTELASVWAAVTVEILK